MTDDDTISHVNVSIIIPTYREVENLKKLIPRIVAVMNLRKDAYEILIVDDHSRDGTEDLVQQFAHQGIPLSLYVRLEERGLATAVLFGMRKAKGLILVCMDADLSHQPEDLPL